MKNFFQFLNEATESQASAQAKKLNLKVMVTVVG